MRYILLSTLVLFATSASADMPDPFVMESPGLTTAAHVFITVLGVVFAMRLASVAFARPPLDFVGVPTNPKYLTDPKSYRLGSSVFVLIAAVIFVVLLFLDREVLAAVKLFQVQIGPEGLLKQFVDALSDRSAPYLVVISFIGLVYLYLLHKEAEWNVLLMLRDVIHDWIAIPSKATTIVEEVIHSLTVPPSYIQRIVDDGAGVDRGDFSRNRGSMDRIWAETSYIRLWLQDRRERGDVQFFNEETFDLDGLLEEYSVLAASVAGVKQHPTPEGISLLTERLKVLRKKFARLVGCYLIRGYGIDDELDRQADDFGLPSSHPADENPLKYVAIYLIAVSLSVYVGVCVSAVMFDWFSGTPLGEALSSQDPAIVLRWIVLSAGNFWVPITIVLLIRFFEWRFYTKSNNTFLVTYCWTAIMAFLIGPFCLAVAVKYIFQVQAYANSNFLETFAYELRWGVGPAIISVFISYYMDRERSAALPGVVRTWNSVLWRVLLSLLVALVAIVLLLVPLLGISAPPGSVWSTDKLRFVAVGSTFFVLFSLAMVAQFGIWRTEDAQPPVAALGR
jgi:hypothetical protein